MRIDLHAHTTASDGTDPPRQLIGAAAAAGLDVVAVTDHDTTDGWAEALTEVPPRLAVVVGIELSCRWWPPDGGRSTGLHLLGYLLDGDDAELRDTCRRLRSSRLARGRTMVERLSADGVPVSWEQVAALAGDASVGRPHVARALVDAGVVTSVDQAFERYLYTGSPYYVGKEELDAVAAVRLVRGCGGVPVFAHPLARRRGRVVGDDAVAALAATGLAGIEVDHPDHSPADRAHLRRLAADLNLLVTGSSDYHGRNKPTRLGADTTDPAAFEAIVAAAAGAVPYRR